MSNKKISIITPEKTKEIQKDWQDYGKANVYYVLFVSLICFASILYHVFMD